MMEYAFARFLREEMKKRGVSQRMLAEMTGYTPASISLWLREKRGMPFHAVLRICEAMRWEVIIRTDVPEEATP